MREFFRMVIELRRRGAILIALALWSLLTISMTAAETISIAGTFGGWGDSLDEALENFGTANNVEVERVDVSGWEALWEKVAVMTAGGIAPDVLYVETTTVLHYARELLSQPLDPFIRDIRMEIYPETVLQAYKMDGHLYAIPTALSLHSLYYNVDRFADAGVNRLPLSWESPELSWDDYVNMARKLTVDLDGDGNPDRFGVQTLGFGNIGFNMVGMWDLHLYNVAGDEWYGDDPAAVAALDRISKLKTEYNAVGGSLPNGTAAIFPVQSYYLNTLAGMSSLNWSVGPMPRGTQRSSQAGFHGVSMSSETKQPELAWGLVKYLTYDPEGTVLFTRAENRVPVHPQARRDFVQRWSHSISLDEAWCIANGVGYAYEDRRARPICAVELRTIVSNAGRRVFNGLASVQQVIDEISPQIRALMKQ